MKASSILAIIFSAIFAQATPAQELLAILGQAAEGTEYGALARLDPETGEATVLGYPSPGNRLSGLAVLPDGRTFVSAHDFQSSWLLQINPKNGSVIRDLGIFSGTDFLNDLAANPLTGELIGVKNDILFPFTAFIVWVYRIDPENAAVSLIFSAFAGTAIEGIAFSDDGRLWGMGRYDSTLYEIDLVQGELVSTSSVSPVVGAVALGNLGGGRLLMAECCTFEEVGIAGEFADQIYELDPNTGAVTLLGFAGAGRHINDIDLGPVPQSVLDVPTLDPLAAILFAAALMLVGVRITARLDAR